MATDEILCSVDDGIATITLNRPDKLNTWTPGMEAGLRELLEQADDDPNVRVIILTGAGKAFCAGADLSGPRSKRLPPPDDAPLGDLEQRYSYIMAIRKPIIAAINGAAAGVGLALALYCDLRFIARGAKINSAFVRRGLIAEHGSSWLLSRLVGHMNAMELLLVGKPIDSARASVIGLANELPAENFLAAVRDIAADLTQNCSPQAMSVIKQQVIADFSRPLGEAVADSNLKQFQSLQTADFKEGVASFLEKRPPDFAGLPSRHRQA